jgi:O-acetylserine/cysteine efflux transporter
MTIIDTFSALLIITIWGFSFVAIKLGVGDMPPLMLTALRFLLAALPMIFILSRPKIPLRYMVGFGVMLGACMFGLVNSAIKLGMPTGLTSIIIQLQAFVTIIVSFFVFKEKPHIWQITGAIIGFIGMAIIGISKSEGVTPLPFFLLIGAGCSWATANIITKLATRASDKPINMFAFVAWSSLFAPPPLIILSLLFEDHSALIYGLSHPTLNVVISTVFLAFAATLLAYGMWTRLLSRYSAAFVTPFALLVPIEGFAAGHFIYNEAFDSLALIGSFTVFFGLALSVFGARLFSRTL